MPISMNPAARYVGQASIYQSPMLGPLTDKAIAKYEEAGYYGTQRRIRALERAAAVANAKKRRRAAKLESLLKMFVP